MQPLNVLIEAKLDAQLAGHCGEFGGEHLTIAGLIVRQAKRATELVRNPGQRRFGPRNAGAIEQFIGHAGRLQHGDVLGGVIQLGLGAEQLGRAALPAFVIDTGFCTQFVEAIATVFGQPNHAFLVHRIARRRAIAQHLRHPQVLLGIAGELDGERRMALHQPLHGFQGYTGRGPG